MMTSEPEGLGFAGTASSADPIPVIQTQHKSAGRRRMAAANKGFSTVRRSTGNGVPRGLCQQKVSIGERSIFVHTRNKIRCRTNPAAFRVTSVESVGGRIMLFLMTPWRIVSTHIRVSLGDQPIHSLLIQQSKRRQIKSCRQIRPALMNPDYTRSGENSTTPDCQIRNQHFSASGERECNLGYWSCP
jgi:hypothetical protein